jgi:hypothetical protein
MSPIKRKAFIDTNDKKKTNLIERKVHLEFYLCPGLDLRELVVCMCRLQAESAQGWVQGRWPSENPELTDGQDGLIGYFSLPRRFYDG